MISPCPAPCPCTPVQQFHRNAKAQDTDLESHAGEGRTLRHRVHQQQLRRQDVNNRRRWLRKLRSGRYDTSRSRRQHHKQQGDGRREQIKKTSIKHRKYRYVSK